MNRSELFATRSLNPKIYKETVVVQKKKLFLFTTPPHLREFTGIERHLQWIDVYLERSGLQNEDRSMIYFILSDKPSQDMMRFKNRCHQLSIDGFLNSSLGINFWEN